MPTIPRSATLTESFTGTHPSDGRHVTYQRYGKATRGGKPIEWVSCVTVWPSGRTGSFTSQATGRSIDGIDGIFTRLKAKFTVNATHTHH
ncbi:hypothetical protein ABH935_007048 [Catenulispora sp. GAS73]|uniref:hypothetical protein n=1 Tax=Catenulispora sp. GAS73 TaxID=3156269 RepID=UPI00351678FB